MDYKIISFYTEPEPNLTYYTNHSKRFIKECESFGLNYYVENLESKNDYWVNCRMKPHFIYSCMKKFDMPLIWLDIDSQIVKKPNESNFKDLDFCAVFRKDVNLSFYVHCLYFRNCKLILEVLEKWINVCDSMGLGKVGDHYPLYEIIKNNPNVKWNYMEDFTQMELSPTSIIKSKKSIRKK